MLTGMLGRSNEEKVIEVVEHRGDMIVIVEDPVKGSGQLIKKERS